jgi:hypothetical protein
MMIAVACKGPLLGLTLSARPYLQEMPYTTLPENIRAKLGPAPHPSAIVASVMMPPSPNMPATERPVNYAWPIWSDPARTVDWRKKNAAQPAAEAAPDETTGFIFDPAPFDAKLRLIMDGRPNVSAVFNVLWMGQAFAPDPALEPNQ